MRIRIVGKTRTGNGISNDWKWRRWKPAKDNRRSGNGGASTGRKKSFYSYFFSFGKQQLVKSAVLSGVNGHAGGEIRSQSSSLHFRARKAIIGAYHQLSASPRNCNEFPYSAITNRTRESGSAGEEDNNNKQKTSFLKSIGPKSETDRLHEAWRKLDQTLFVFPTQNCDGPHSEEENALSNSQLREGMKHRITELLQALEKVKRNSELRQQQQDEVILDLKRSNA